MSDEGAGKVSAFIREHQHDILAGWETSVRALPIARRLDRSTLIDHIPAVLERIAETTEELGTGVALRDGLEVETTHAIERLECGFDLAEVVIELGILRNAILTLLLGAQFDGAELQLLDEAVDLTVRATIDRFAKARERTLHTLDQIASAALESRTLDELLNRLLNILVQTSRAIDHAAILVPEGEFLSVRVSVGIAGELVHHGYVPMVDSFAGTIATTRKPVEVDDARTDPLVKQPALRESGVRALYGIPLIEAGEVIAVAHIGSFAASEFSVDDKRLFRAVCSHATSAIFQHMLRETAERTSLELREREQEFHVLADNIPQFAWMTDADGEPYWFNQRWLDFAGTTLEAMRHGGAGPYVHPDHFERVMETFRATLATGQRWEDTFPLRGKTGTYRWFLSRAIPVFDHAGTIVRWFGTNTDITQQRFLDDATRVLNSSLDYHDTLQRIAQLAVPDLADWCVVDLVDKEGEVHRLAIAHTNPARLEFAHEWAREYPPNWRARAGVPNVIRTGRPEFYPQLADRDLVAVSRDVEHLAALRSLGLKSCIIAPLLARGRTLGAITLLTSESQRNYTTCDFELARELGRRAGIAVDNARLYDDSQQALREREEAVKSRDEVLAIVSHDLRGPLSAIGLSAALLQDESSEVASRKRAALIKRSADRMERMINDLLDMSTIQRRGLTLNRTAEDPEEILAGVVDSHEATAASKGVAIVRDTDLSMVTLWCDRDLLERVFGNLIGNALTYGSGDITLHGHVVNDHALFSVADSGPGIPPDQQLHLFEPYWTAKSNAAKKGTGLGLYICKGLVEAHGGQLWVDSDSDGTEFFFTVPLADVARASPRHDDQPAGGPLVPMPLR